MNLDKARKEIDKIDIKIINLISKRQTYLPMIAKYKRENNLKIVQLDRERQAIDTRVKIALRLGVSEKLVSEIFKKIFRNSVKIQREI